MIAPNDQQGFTLQTLIITAVLAFVATVASVIIFAIANNTTRDAREQSATPGNICQAHEIYEPNLASRGIGGDDNGGIYSSAIGCLPVCYIEGLEGLADDGLNTDGIPYDNARLRFRQSSLPIGTVDINGFNLFGTDFADDRRAVVIGDVLIRGPASPRTNPSTLAAADLVPTPRSNTNVQPIDSRYAIRVSANQAQCEIYETNTGRVIHISS